MAQGGPRGEQLDQRLLADHAHGVDVVPEQGIAQRVEVQRPADQRGGDGED
jgi:hypothetical protein